MIPLILLDVDGVIVPFYDPQYPPPASWDSWVSGRGPLKNMKMSRGVRSFLWTLHGRGLAQVMWHTSWRERVDTTLAPAFSLPNFPTASTHEEYVHHRPWWKIGAVERLLPSQPIIWIDDDINYSLARGELDHLKDNNRLLLISPETALGLTPTHVHLIEKTLQGWNDTVMGGE